MPFNGLEVDLPDQFGSCSEDSPCDGLTHIDLPSQMNLKYLEITTEWFRDGCQNFPDPIKAMVHKHANEIQELDIPGVGFLKELLTDQPPNFPVLQEITLSQTSGMDPVAQKNILRNLATVSPSLGKIYIGHIDILEIIPQEQYKLLGNLELFLEDIFKEDFLLRNIVNRKPELRVLIISECCYVEEGRRQELCTVLTQLLESCQESLEQFELHVYEFHVLPLLTSNALTNLSNFTLETMDETGIQELWNSFVSIDSDQMMPNLRKVVIIMNFRTEQVIEWPTIRSEVNVHYSWSNVQKLELLALSLVAWNMLEIRTVFPHLTSLKLSPLEPERLLCPEFWEVWSNLQELNISGPGGVLRQNFDAEFCGINEEEAELLRDMDDEFLKRVQIVPIRPSLLTMQSKCP